MRHQNARNYPDSCFIAKLSALYVPPLEEKTYFPRELLLLSTQTLPQRSRVQQCVALTSTWVCRHCYRAFCNFIQEHRQTTLITPLRKVSKQHATHSVSRSFATSSISRLMSTPSQTCPARSNASPLRPLPHPTSSMKHDCPGCGRSYFSQNQVQYRGDGHTRIGSSRKAGVNADSAQCEMFRRRHGMYR